MTSKLNISEAVIKPDTRVQICSLNEDDWFCTDEGDLYRLSEWYDGRIKCINPCGYTLMFCGSTYVHKVDVDIKYTKRQ